MWTGAECGTSQPCYAKREERERERDRGGNKDVKVGGCIYFPKPAVAVLLLEYLQGRTHELENSTHVSHTFVSLPVNTK